LPEWSRRIASVTWCSWSCDRCENRHQSIPDTIRDSLQAEAITKEVPVNQVFDFSYLPARAEIAVKRGNSDARRA